MYYLNYFFIFSFVGYIFENIVYVIMKQKADSGFLYGCWTPVYGLGAITVIYLSKIIFKSLKLNKFLEILIFILITTLVLTFIEWVGGHLLHFIFHKNFWDYENMKYNIGKYISLEVSFIWLIMSLAFLYLIKPWMDKIVNLIPNYITYILIFLFIIDIIITLINKNKLVK